MSEKEYNSRYRQFSMEFYNAYTDAKTTLRRHKREFGNDYIGVEIAQSICDESIHSAQVKYDTQMSTLNE